MSDRLDLSLLAMFGLILVVCVLFTVWSIEQPKMCSVSFGIQADINIQSDLMQNVKINNISISAPCGNDMFSMVNTMEWGR